jgi:TonB family protein
MLALGFRDLSAQAMAPPPAPAPPVQSPVATAAVAPPPPVAAAPQAPRVYASSDANVLPPAAIRQELPPYGGTLFKAMQGIVEVVVDENGGVVSAAIRAPMNNVYDRQVLAAAAAWRYKPALLDGTPVKYRKFIQIALTPK